MNADLKVLHAFVDTLTPLKRVVRRPPRNAVPPAIARSLAPMIDRLFSEDDGLRARTSKAIEDTLYPQTRELLFHTLLRSARSGTPFVRERAIRAFRGLGNWVVDLLAFEIALCKSDQGRSTWPGSFPKSPLVRDLTAILSLSRTAEYGQSPS